MKILFVSGTDYSAFYVNEHGPEKFYEIIETGRNVQDYIDSIEDEDTKEGLDGAEFEILECNPIDEKFLDWIETYMIDYDHAKGSNYFIIEE